MKFAQKFFPVSMLLIGAAAALAGKTWYELSAVDRHATETSVDLPAQDIATPPSDAKQHALQQTRDTQVSHELFGRRAEVSPAGGHISANESSGETVSEGATENPKPPSEPHESEESLNRMISDLNATFQTQEVADDWSTRSSETISGYFNEMAQENNNFGSELRNVECRSTMCKVEVLLQDSAAVDEFTLTFPGRMGELLPNISYQYEHLPDGRINLLMFLVSADTSEG